ncbi:hypothetical protein [Spirosoma spitsbergense]|uniref:hypothetical protein n=1 Tax=Spirosoma spitsbergense TaxID=431554 RepID=UPI00037E274F|nr:hypothetical protein [Spirosoma spitsbergense]
MNAPLLFIILLVCGSAFYRPPGSYTAKGTPTEAEVRAYFTKYNADWTVSHQYTEPTISFQKIQIAPPTKYNFVGVGWQVCYPVKIDWTAGYTYAYRRWRYTSRYTNDYYRFYRNDFGELEVGDHKNGQSTDQKVDY